MFQILHPSKALDPVTTFTVFKFAKEKIWWAFGQMGRKTLENPKGATFSKMLGSGRKGFDIIPNFRQYTFLAQWESAQCADEFFASPDFRNYAAQTAEHYTIKMSTIQSHGQWDGAEPFQTAENIEKEYTGPIVVLTRAKINFTKLLDFWRHVPKAHLSLKKSKGVLLAFGIGENPITQQATISVWDSVESLKKFAYHRPGHKEIVKRTRQRGWYSEELFARFIPVAVDGGVLFGYPKIDSPSESTVGF
ncbi:DUF3291 domain-containing protein [Persicitalea jodogahamensis]|uniref:DUF3291 domain-containing protein n=1 Tax=Persicitalea jodogahamensis TaxID=402147 RepID=A0A8J3D214_9BACT|nr:DUF3291 domain-containing protein [Persicitalea jodogahamensis]GHB55525.1 hypothetical protein GCM10007390_05910 [Persicitalea jodogahamensis]